MADTPSPSSGAPLHDVPIRRVGFIGLGDMGGAIAARIIAAGFPTVLWARRPAALTRFAGPGVDTAAGPAELAAVVDYVGICVWDDDAVRAVVLGEGGVLAGSRPGTVIAIHSTTSTALCREMVAAAEQYGVSVIDAAVSGGRDVALAGRLVVAAGGDAAVIDRCRPVISTFADLIVHLGAVGTGQLAKLINNTLLAANLALAVDALAVGETLGIPAHALVQVLGRGSGRSVGLEVAIATRSSDDKRQRALPLLRKDVRSLADEVAYDDAAGSLLSAAADVGITRLTAPPGGSSSPQGE